MNTPRISSVLLAVLERIFIGSLSFSWLHGEGGNGLNAECIERHGGATVMANAAEIMRK
jgi:hypothetical protein